MTDQHEVPPELLEAEQRKREQWEVEKSEAPSESLPKAKVAETKQVWRTCRECNEDFGTTVVVYDGVERGGAQYCDECLEDLDTFLDERPALPGSLNSVLRRMGVNVNAHGSFGLDDDFGVAIVRDTQKFLARVWDDDEFAYQKGLYIHGSTGVGKTVLSVALLKALLEKSYPHQRVVFDRARALITEIQDTYGSGGVESVVNKRRNAGVWFLDDVGAEKPTADAFRIIEDILDSREGRPMVWTSNYSPEQLASRWAGEEGADRFRSRLNTFEFLELGGDDRRFR